MTSRFYLTIVIFAICVIELRARPSSLPCPQSHIPEGSQRGVNKIEGGKSRYWLDVGEARRGYVPNRTYIFVVGAQDSKYPFDDVVLTASSTDDNCGSGQFTAMDNQYQPLNCPDVISTEQKKSMDHVPFQWTAPNCGCTHVRATVITSGVYYQEPANETDADLAKVVCPQEPETSKQNNAMELGRHYEDFASHMVSRCQKIQELCEIVRNISNVNLIRRQFFSRRGIEETELIRLSEFEQTRLETVMDHRRLDVVKCCHQNGNEQMECFGDIRRHRIDRFCAVGEPEIPFTKTRETWMRDREEDCCWRLGEERYQCFNYTNYNSERPKEFTEGGDYIDQSMDDFDPANDIDDYQKQDENLETMLSKGVQTSNETSRTNSKKSMKKDGITGQPQNPNFAVESRGKPNADDEDSDYEDGDYDYEDDYDENEEESDYDDEDDDDSDEDSENENSDDDSDEDSAYEESSYDEESDYDDDSGDIDHDDNDKEYPESLSLRNWKQELRSRAEKNQLKLECCTEGENLGFSISKSVKAYRECPKASRQFSISMKSRRQMCRTSFLQCCLEAAVSRASKAPTHKTRIGDDETPSNAKRLKSDIEVSTVRGFSIGQLETSETDLTKSTNGKRTNKRKNSDLKSHSPSEDVDSDQSNARTTKRNRAKPSEIDLKKDDSESSVNKKLSRNKKRHRSKSSVRKNGGRRLRQD